MLMDLGVVITVRSELLAYRDGGLPFTLTIAIYINRYDAAFSSVGT